jgi:hypothetical protein
MYMLSGEGSGFDSQFLHNFPSTDEDHLLSMLTKGERNLLLFEPICQSKSCFLKKRLLMRLLLRRGTVEAAVSVTKPITCLMPENYRISAV